MLTEFENFSITRELTGYLSKLNDTGTLEGRVFSRAIGFASLPFTCLADASVHISFVALKIITGLSALFYNVFAEGFFPEYKITAEYELPSAIIHALRTVQFLIKTAFLPVINSLDPLKANLIMHDSVEPVTPT